MFFAKGGSAVFADPLTGIDTPLFNPRSHIWAEHFRWDNVVTIGLTPIGRATVEALQMNRPMILAIRDEEGARGRHPSDT